MPGILNVDPNIFLNRKQVLKRFTAATKIKQIAPEVRNIFLYVLIISVTNKKERVYEKTDDGRLKALVSQKIDKTFSHGIVPTVAPLFRIYRYLVPFNGRSFYDQSPGVIDPMKELMITILRKIFCHGFFGPFPVTKIIDY